MEHLLFAAYLVLFAWLVTKVRFFRDSGLSPAQLIIIFLLKVMAGIFYGWIGVYYGELAQMVDTWAYHYESLREYQLLLDQPSEFFHSIFRNTYEDGYGKFLSTENSWWNDLKGTVLVKTIALLNLLTTGQYYINVIFFSFITLFGPVALYRVMRNLFPANRMAVLLGTFLVPSFLYWTSGLHKDGLIFLGFALIVYHLYFGFRERRWPWHRLALMTLGFLMVLALRNFLIIVLLPAAAAWAASQRLRFRPLYIYLTVYAVFLLFFFTAGFISPRLDFPHAVAARQQEFLQLRGGSAVDVDRLDPSVRGFLVNAPQAFSLSVLRPYPADVRHLLSLAAALEINSILLLFLLFLVCRKRQAGATPFLLFCLFFSFSLMMMVGYTVNFLGAIVRYRSLVLPFLVVPVVAQIDWQRVSQLLNRHMINNKNV